MIYHLIFHNMKNINFQVEFHVFCMFEKKACFIPILVNRVGLTAGPHYNYGRNAKPERAVREGL